MAPDEAAGQTLRAYGLLHEQAPDAVVATLEEVRAGAAAHVVVAFADGDPEGTVGDVDALLPGGSLGVLVAPWRRRRRVRRALEAAGLALRAELLPLPEGTRPERLTSVDRHLLQAVLPAGRGLRRIWAVLLRVLPGAAATVRLRPTAYVVEREGVVRYGVWLQRLVAAADPRRVIVQRGRDREGVVAVWPPGRREPVGYVKLGRVRGEAAALEHVAPRAAAAGARVPAILAVDGERLATSAVAGRRASDVLVEQPGHFGEVVTAVALWLERWHGLAAAPRRWTAEDTQRHLLDPLAALEGRLEPAYRGWLEERVAGIEGFEVRIGPAHGDLTMANVLLEGTVIGVVDWEAASAEAPPFVDLPYALADAAAARKSYRDRPAAFASVFGSTGPEATLASSLFSRAAAGHGMRPDVLAVAFHACWLHHAANDVRREVAGQPFVAIAAAVASDPERYDPLIAGA